MTNARHIWAVAEALQREVRPFITDRDARATLDNGIRVLTATANGLEMGPSAFMGSPSPVQLADTDRLGGPAENAAAYRTTGAVIADVAGCLDRGDQLTAFRDAIAGERSLLESTITRMDEVERAPPRRVGADKDSIDPKRLEAYLRQRTGREELRVDSFNLVVGGRSRQTALLGLTNMGDLPARLVIQRGIPNLATNDSFLDELTQFNLLGLLHKAGMRVPAPVLVETDPAWLDAPFMLVEHAPGATAQPEYWLPVADRNVVLDLARQMAILHKQPIDEVGQGLRPSRSSFDIESWQAELEGMASEWHDLARWPSITMSAAISWLRANVDCLDDRQSIVHNDMIFHNVLAENGNITAVLDWEQAAIGHAGEDLGYCYPVVIAATDWESFMDAYRAAGGLDIPQRQIDYFALRAGLRLMNLVLKGGRDTFEKGLSDDILVASAGAHFTQRLMHRIALVLRSVLERS
ncbi:phosphotransferase [Sphingobium sp. Cam5-1]|uniref:phosphotransferase n=1 Tax=Sphingobium sp. Cam5-1 TaxID=2789327 RepID=UPI0018AD2D31|nr:phosphotransferase [Sphingobium sp. Cam5-1]QPI74886.1 phosphotransferase [Sphingobium sp. Cam5-1]